MFFFSATASLYSQTALGFQGVGARLGYVRPEEFSWTNSYEAFGDFGKINDIIMLHGRAGYWSDSSNAGTLRDIFVGASLAYELQPSASAFTPYVGGGLSLHFMRSKRDFSDLVGEDVPLQISSDSDVAVDIMSGFILKLAAGVRLNAEAMLSVTDITQFTIRGGLIYQFVR